jgi:hypothetical protein
MKQAEGNCTCRKKITMTFLVIIKTAFALTALKPSRILQTARKRASYPHFISGLDTALHACLSFPAGSAAVEAARSFWSMMGRG